MRRGPRLLATLLVTGGAIAYLIWKVDLAETWDVLKDTHGGYLFGSFLIMALTVWPMAWRWQRLLRARGIDEPLSWLVRAYFTAYAAGQMLPTALGGDAMRMFETSRRHPGKTGPVAGSVLLERALGGAATLTLAAIGFALALGHYDVGAYLWIEGVFVAGTIVLGVLIFSRSAKPLLLKLAPLLRALRIGRPAREVYLGLHGFREHAGLVFGAFFLTIAIQAVRVLAIWMAAKAAGVDLSPRVYYVMGPLLFLVMLVPFTINGIAVREGFFVSFLGQLGVAAEQAFAAGFLFFLVTVALSVPGGVILFKEGIHGALARPRREPDG